MRFLSMLVPVVLGLFFSDQLAHADDKKKDDIPARIGGVKIIHQVSDDFYPAYWKRDPKIKPVAKEVDRKELLRIIPLIHTFVKDYPEAILKKNLKGIYLCRTLQFYGKDFGGTNSADGVYICIRTEEEGYTNTFLLSSLHHEFSSILMRNYKFPKKEWEALNPKDFKYTDDAVGALGQEDLLLPQDKYQKIGFICLYSQSSMEEDFNTFADYLFNQRPELLKMAQSHPKLKAKLLLAMKFYKSVNAGFTFGELEPLNK